MPMLTYSHTGRRVPVRQAFLTSAAVLDAVQTDVSIFRTIFPVVPNGMPEVLPIVPPLGIRMFLADPRPVVLLSFLGVYGR